MATDKKEIRPVPKKDIQKKDKAKPATNKKARKVDLKKTALAVGHFFRDVVSEMKKVTWASRKEFISYSVAVVVFVTVFGLIIFAMDSALAPLVSTLPNLFG
jgi:preprotein translocase subunit SecE